MTLGQRDDRNETTVEATAIDSRRGVEFAANDTRRADELTYLDRRYEDEMHAAGTAPSRDAKLAHLEMAVRYAVLARDVRLGQVCLA